jgi:hypothetical protein
MASGFSLLGGVGRRNNNIDKFIGKGMQNTMGVTM